jgi:DNA-binding CsgD family transcriptional regulator
MQWSDRERAAQRIAALSAEGLDTVSFWRECSPLIASAVPHYLAPCWFSLDPASLLVTGHYHDGIPEIPPEWLAQEYLEDDVNKMADVARSPAGIATLHGATGGEPWRSPRYERDMRPYGAEQELLLGLRAPDGTIWGALGLYREPGTPLFDDGDFAFLRAVASSLAEGTRRGLLLGEATDPEGEHSPGLLLLDSHFRVESISPNADAFLRELPGDEWADGVLPPAFFAVAGQTLRAGNGEPTRAAVARVRTRSGGWLVLHGMPLQSRSAASVGIVIERAGPARIAGLLMAAYRLTPREQELTRLVLRGASTAEIAATLAISPHTVQQHLKSVFEKTGVRSRRDLAGKVFFANYEPRVRENETRTTTGKAMRGEPLPCPPETQP